MKHLPEAVTIPCSFLAALMLVWLPSEADAFGCLVTLMHERGMRELYKEDLAMLQASPGPLTVPLCSAELTACRASASSSGFFSLAMCLECQ